MKGPDRSADLSRRAFLAGVGGALASTTTGLWLESHAASAAEPLVRVDSLPTTITRTWIGPQYWSNRVGDWRLSNGRIECLTAGAGGRTVGVLSHALVSGPKSASLAVRTGTLATGTGFSGFVVGTGAGALDWRAAALVMGASGFGGGLLAVYDSDGQVRFRDHTSESSQFRFADLGGTDRSGPAPARRTGEDVLLRLDIDPAVSGAFDLTLTASQVSTGALLSRLRRLNVPDTLLTGGISLVSSTRGSGLSVRHWFAELATAGAKVPAQGRSAGPVLGVLFSLAASVLKMTAQFMPIGAADPKQAVLQRRQPGASAWQTVQTVSIGDGFAAIFRVPAWDGTRTWEFRVGWALGSAQEAFYPGSVPAEPPEQRALVIGMINCTIHSFRNLDAASKLQQPLPGARPLGLYTADNLYFPYKEIVTGLLRRQVNMLVAFGDQYYEDKPTQKSSGADVLDVLSRYYLWLWSFGELTRNMPTICLVDDHDLYHPNIWGWSGRAAPQGDYHYGGYLMAPSWVNAVQRIQTGHNPDPYDPAPVLQGITVYYTAFSYGGVSFVALEDRKFKNTNATGTNPDGTPLPAQRDLLGARQEALLSAWATMHGSAPKICLTQSLFASVLTNPDRRIVADADSNGTPVAGRLRALQRLTAAHALILSGDRHLATLVRHGLSTFTDGPWEFTAPAAGTSWVRWFQPTGQLPNGTLPYTGDVTDGFGNKLRVLAVANPVITYRQVRDVQAGNAVGDRRLKAEGYAVVRVDKQPQQMVLECWPWDAGAASAQYPGWPVTLPWSSL